MLVPLVSSRCCRPVRLWSWVSWKGVEGRGLHDRGDGRGGCSCPTMCIDGDRKRSVRRVHRLLWNLFFFIFFVNFNEQTIFSLKLIIFLFYFQRI